MLKHIAELFATERTFSAPVPGAMRNMRWEALTRFLDDGTIELDNSAVECSIRPTILNRKCALRRLRVLLRHRFGDRNRQAERRRSSPLDVALTATTWSWEGTRQVALLTRSNFLLNSGGFLLLGARRPSGRLLGTINSLGAYLDVPGSSWHLCV
jgi:Transposase IS66 family